MDAIEVIITEKLKCKALRILFIVLPKLRRASFENVDELNGDILAFFKRHSIEYKYGSPWQISMEDTISYTPYEVRLTKNEYDHFYFQFISTELIDLIVSEVEYDPSCEKLFYDSVELKAKEKAIKIASKERFQLGQKVLIEKMPALRNWISTPNHPVFIDYDEVYMEGGFKVIFQKDK